MVRKTRLAASVIMVWIGLAALGLGATGCGEPISCWCRCPSGSSVEFTQTTDPGTSCESICQDFGCFYEGGEDCSPGTTRDCTCDDGLVGRQTCGSGGAWGECTQCASPPICEEGDRDPCECESGQLGWQYCEDGAWSACTECTSGALVYADIDYGTEGVIQGGAYQDVYNSVEWGCRGVEPDLSNSLIWRVFPRDDAHPESIWFELSLPEGLLTVDVIYYEMSLTGEGGVPSQMEVLINGTLMTESFPVEAGCVRETEADHPLGAFIPGATNRITVWSVNNGSGAHHGLQGVWVYYTFQE